MANLQIIKELAVRKNITLDQLSKDLGITPQALSKIMRENSTRIDTLERIASELAVPVAIFFETKSCGDCSPIIMGDGNESHSTKQVNHGNHSHNVNGDNNKVGDGESFDKFIGELAAQRGLAERTLAMLEARDRQMERMLDTLQQIVNSK